MKNTIDPIEAFFDGLSSGLVRTVLGLATMIAVLSGYSSLRTAYSGAFIYYLPIILHIPWCDLIGLGAGYLLFAAAYWLLPRWLIRNYFLDGGGGLSPFFSSRSATHSFSRRLLRQRKGKPLHCAHAILSVP